MSDYSDAVNAVYSDGGIASRLFKALKAAGIDIDNLTLDALDPLEELHLGGRRHTFQMAELAGLTPGMHVVDIGCGIGGPARALAHHFGCKVKGVDLTEEFCTVGRMLTERTGLADLVEIHHGDAVDLPFDDGVFDQAWMQHTATNVPDKARLFTETARVLRPGGKMVLYEVLSGTKPVVHFPVPWTRDETVSFVVGEEEFLGHIESAGFKCGTWEHLTQKLIAFLSRVLSKPADKNGPGLNPGVILGPEYRTMMENVLKNLKEDRMRVIQAVFALTP